MFAVIHKLASPKWFYQFAKKLTPISMVLAILLLAYGLITGLYYAPADYQQGNAFRIIYIHVPAAFLSLSVYMSMATAAFISLVWRIKLADLACVASAPIGASFTAIALITGSIWGKPMWGAWWIWDARLTSELILLFLYFGYIALVSTLPNRSSALKAGNILLLVGVINIPIIHYSVVWWHTLHQGATLSRLAKPAIDSSMLYPLLAMIAGFGLLYVSLLFTRMRAEILTREQHSQWVQQLCRGH